MVKGMSIVIYMIICLFHWLKVASLCDRQRECNIFVNIAKKIPLLTNAESVVACFEALCGVRQCQNLQKEHPSFCNPDDAKFIALIGLLQSIGLSGGQYLHTNVLSCL